MEEELRRVLVVDPSRVVRTTLAKHLRGHFAVREEADGEAAWQTLVLDASIVAVVSGTQLPRLGSLELLARLRGKKLRRLADIPFLLLVSGNEPDVLRARAHEGGVTDFLTRGLSRDEVLGRIGRLVDWDLATDFSQPAGADAGTPPAPAKPAAPQREATAARVPVLTAKALRQALQSALTRAAGASGMIGVLAFRLDDHAALGDRVGEPTVAAITAHLAHVLRTKVGTADSIGCDDEGRCLIVAPGTSLASCDAFAQRVCRGLANSQVNVAGEAFKLRVSAGIASLPADSGRSARELVALAAERLQRAQRAGGMRVVGDDAEAQAPIAGEALAGLAPTATTTAEQQLGQIGLQLMPLLRAFEDEFAFGLPLQEMARRFELRAREENSGR